MSRSSWELCIDMGEIVAFVLGEFGSGRLSSTSSSSFSLVRSPCWFSSWWNIPQVALCHIGGMLGSTQIHFDDPKDTQQFGMVQFQATTLLAPGDSAPEPLPLLVFLSGLEGLGGIKDTTVRDQMTLRKWPVGSLLLVAPLRKPSHWWFSDNCKNYGWLEGNLDVELVCNMALLLEELAKHPRVDPRKIVLYGFSAGAYAISELLTTHQSVIA
eukprot:6480119-Amphidinium_carterae.1